MKEMFTAKTAGLPRYVWLAGLAGGIILGLYLRARRAERGGSPAPQEDAAALPEGDPGSLYFPGGVGFNSGSQLYDVAPPPEVVSVPEIVTVDVPLPAEAQPSGGPPMKPTPVPPALAGYRIDPAQNHDSRGNFHFARKLKDNTLWKLYDNGSLLRADDPAAPPAPQPAPVGGPPPVPVWSGWRFDPSPNSDGGGGFYFARRLRDNKLYRWYWANGALSAA